MYFLPRYTPTLFCGLLALAGGLAGCAPDQVTAEPPLRPLLYTEGPAVVESLGGLTEWTDPSVDPVAYPSEHSTALFAAGTDHVVDRRTPESLIMSVFFALLDQAEVRIDDCLFDAESLSTAARMGMETARDEAASIRSDTLATMALFHPGPESQARPGGLARMLRAGQLELGRPRTIDGAVVDEDQTPAMHWGSELTFHLTSRDVGFVLRFPKLLRDESGEWRLGAAPTVSPRFRTFRDIGMDLKPELMDVEHAEYPLHVGNYWDYQTRRPGAGAGADGFGVITNEGFRDGVVEVDDHTSYRVATVRRTYDNPDTPPARTAYLVTPLRVYTCNRECQRRAESMAWILEYAENRVPILIFPLAAGTNWGTGGSTETPNSVFRVQPEWTELEVPAGTFPHTAEIVRSTSRGREATFFTSGIGVLMWRNQTPNETEIIELLSYRIMQ